MRAVRYLEPGRPFELRAVAIPTPGRGDVRVRIEACGICRTELHLRDGLLDLGRRDFTVGHEIAGRIDDVGEDVDAERIGERVVIYYYEGCGNCVYCRDGDEQLCAATRGQPGFTTDGGYADFIVVRAHNCVPVPASIPLTTIAPMGCAGSTAVHAGRMAKIAPSDWVVVHGTGGVGQALLQYALACGARVVAIDLGSARTALATRLGATAVIDAWGEQDVVARVLELTGGGSNVVFELVGSTDTMRRSIAMLGRRGRLVLVGYTAQELSIHPVDLIVREAQILGSVGSTLQDLHECVDLVARGLITPFIDRTLPLEAFAEGMSDLERGIPLGRIVLTT